MDELGHIFNQLQISENTTFIWGGDFNLFFDIDLDAEGGSPKLKIKSLSKLLSIMPENDLRDIYRVRNPEAKHQNWNDCSDLRFNGRIYRKTVQKKLKIEILAWSCVG